jgi:hypothetical protein
MSATVHRLARPDALLTKQQLAAHLDRSTRWIEMRVREGMPSEEPTTRFPHRRFKLADVEAWLANSEPRPDRLSILEAQVARLTATVERLERRTA